MNEDTNTTETIIDHIDQIVVPGTPFVKPANEYYALVFLRDGLEFLFTKVEECEELAVQRINPDGHLEVASMGNDPNLDDLPRTLLHCAFHWYAVSACQYVRTVGAIAHDADDSRLSPLQYVRHVIPEVLAIRDKVAAHFAWATRNKKDSEAERNISVMPTLTFLGSEFVMGAWALSVVSSGAISDSAEISPWSISGIHRRLRNRYWPELPDTTPVI